MTWKKPTLEPPVVEILIFSEKNTDASNLRQPWHIVNILSHDKFVTFKSVPNSRIMCPCPNSFCGNFLFPFPISTLILSLWWWFDLNWGLDWGRARCLGGWWAGHPLPSSTACERTHPLPASPCHKSQHEQYKKDADSVSKERSYVLISCYSSSLLSPRFLFVFVWKDWQTVNTLLPN